MNGPALRLGVNIDHVATVRNARGSAYPSPLRAAQLAAEAGADGITAHLREDRRHIQDADIALLRNEVPLPLNFEMAATAEMVAIAAEHTPHAACIVPEKREEVTTEGGLNAAGQHKRLAPIVTGLAAAGCRVSLFIEADSAQLRAAASLGVPVVDASKRKRRHWPPKQLFVDNLVTADSARAPVAVSVSRRRAVNMLRCRFSALCGQSALGELS